MLAPFRLFNALKLKHNTKSYVQYNWENNNETEKIKIINLSTFEQYKNYVLVPQYSECGLPPATFENRFFPPKDCKNHLCVTALVAVQQANPQQSG